MNHVQDTYTLVSSISLTNRLLLSTLIGRPVIGGMKEEEHRSPYSAPT